MTFNGREINTGVITTDDTCRGCNKCIAGCPVFGANIAAVSDDGTSRVYVDQDACIQCGRCIDRCTHDARHYNDDTTRLIRDLETFRNGQRRRPISLVFAPSFFINYPQKGPQLLGWLKSLGAWHIYSAAFGADIAVWAYIQYIQRTGRPGLISSACPAVVEAVEKHYPALVEQLIPVQSPQMCTAIYLRDQLRLETDIAFISPCIAKKNEIQRPENRSFVQYNVSFAQLLQATRSMDLSHYEALSSELDFGPGALFPVPGGLRENLGLYLGEDMPLVLQAEGPDQIYPLLAACAKDDEDEEEIPATLLDVLSCQRGCVYGTATQFKDEPLGHIPREIDRLRRQTLTDGLTPPQRLEALNQRFKGLDLKKYMASYYDRTRTLGEPEAEEIDEIFHSLYKFTQEDQTTDCSACGYASCRQMAQAIALGINHPRNCINYVRTRMGIEHAHAVAGQQRLEQISQSGVESFVPIGADQLTGLGTRYTFEQRLAQVLENGYEGYVFSVDLDDFMAVNESYGHTAGNTLLMSIARFLQDGLGGLCDVFRSGGDEFTLIAEGVDEATAQYIANTLLHRVREPWEAGELRLFCTISMGMTAIAPEATLSDLVTQLDLALAAAKARGKNTCASYSVELEKGNSSQVLLLHQLRDDVLGGCRGMEVYYQPWVTCEGDLLGAEALIRWRDLQGRFVSPGEFIPVAESAGLIIQIGDFIMRRAAEKCLEINQRLPYFTISINVSARQFARPDFLEHTLSILDDVGVDKKNIILEITESLGFDDIARQREILNRLMDTGVQIAMDDFGTGYSSLSYLSELPLNIVKIDRTFIRDLVQENYSKYLLTSMTELMHKMGRKVVVEGVETRQQLDLCESFGVDIIQGFLFFRPMPANQLTQLVNIS